MTALDLDLSDVVAPAREMAVAPDSPLPQAIGAELVPSPVVRFFIEERKGFPFYRGNHFTIQARESESSPALATGRVMPEVASSVEQARELIRERLQEMHRHAEQMLAGCARQLAELDKAFVDPKPLHAHLRANYEGLVAGIKGFASSVSRAPSWEDEPPEPVRCGPVKIDVSHVARSHSLVFSAQEYSAVSYAFDAATIALLDKAVREALPFRAPVGWSKPGHYVCTVSLACPRRG